MMSSQKPPGVVLSAVLVLLAVAAIFCGVDAITAEMVTTPARFGGDTRVYGTGTLFVGAGWIVVGIALCTSLISSHLKIRAGRWVALGLCGVGGGLWLAACV